MNGFWTIETNALPVNAARIAGEVLGQYHSASQGGRLGTELTIAPYDAAEKVAQELREYGYAARMTPRKS